MTKEGRPLRSNPNLMLIKHLLHQFEVNDQVRVIEWTNVIFIVFYAKSPQILAV